MGLRGRCAGTCASGGGLCCWSRWSLRLTLHALCNRLLCHVTGTGNLGADRGNLSQSHPGPAVSIAVSALWIACFVLTFTFPLLNQLLKTAGTFWLYSAICLAGLVFIVLRVPETKGKTLEQIEQEITSRR